MNQATNPALHTHSMGEFYPLMLVSFGDLWYIQDSRTGLYAGFDDKFAVENTWNGIREWPKASRAAEFMKRIGTSDQPDDFVWKEHPTRPQDLVHPPKEDPRYGDYRRAEADFNAAHAAYSAAYLKVKASKQALDRATAALFR